MILQLFVGFVAALVLLLEYYVGNHARSLKVRYVGGSALYIPAVQKKVLNIAVFVRMFLTVSR